MHLSHLSLTNFRNYVRLELDLGPGVTVLQGDNAQGKTNLLEAMHILATTKPLRGATERDLVNWVAVSEPLAGARLAGDVRSESGPARIEVLVTLAPADGNGQSGGAVKRYRINGVPRRAGDVLGNLIVVLFSPQDIEIVAGAPATRRRYLDIAISQMDRRYLRALQQYARVLLQRNSLLRLIREGRAGRDQLEFWDQQLVEHGSGVLWARRRFVADLNDQISETHSRLAGRPEHMLVTYASTASDLAADEPASVEETAEQLRRRLDEGRDKECANGASLYGPHRDDLRFSVDGVDVQSFGSRGQQRTVALALKLCESATITRATGRRPVLLLDDVMSELDQHRRQHVVDSIGPDQQVLVTCTDFGDLEPRFLQRATCLSVVDGRLAPAAPLLAQRTALGS